MHKKILPAIVVSTCLKNFYARGVKFFTALFLAMCAALFSVFVSVSVSASATAGEIIFYEYAGLAGQQMSLRSTTANFESTGFNDRANSLVVRSGTWLVCTDAEFRGYCATFAPGEYRSLNSRYANQISSAREVDAFGNSASDVNIRSRTTIELFDQRDFGGESLLLESNAESFVPLNFNDRAISMVVSGGAGVVWELCTDAGYRGTCRRYGVGRYVDLGLGIAREISSARLISTDQTPSPILIGGVDPNAVVVNVGNLTLFDADGFLGHGINISNDTANLENVGFNDATQSILIERGTWEFCTNANYRGVCRVLGPGYYRRLDADFFRTISSARITAALPTAVPTSTGSRSMGSRNPGDGGEVIMFDRHGFMGRSFSTRTNVGSLSDVDFNDRAVSLIVNAGRWEMCSDAGFAGQCVVYGPGRYDNLQDVEKKLSSLRRLK